MSHLSTLIGRVRKCEFAGCPEATECGAGEFLEQALREKLINIAEFMTYSHDYTQNEASEAVELLCKHDMGDLVCNPKTISSYITAFYAQTQRTTTEATAEPTPTSDKPVGVTV